MGSKLRRRVITFPVLKILGHEIFASDLDKYDKLLIWSVSTLAFFTCCRMGEIIFQSKTNFDKTSNFVWGRLQVISDDHYVIYSPCPKVSVNNKGFVMDVLPYTDEIYCPLKNLKKSVTVILIFITNV